MSILRYICILPKTNGGTYYFNGCRYVQKYLSNDLTGLSVDQFIILDNDDILDYKYIYFIP